MSEWRPKRFWRVVAVSEDGEGPRVFLDDRPLRTPAKAAMTLPTAALAAAVAAEWDAQGDVIDPGSMPMTRIANTAIDTVAPQRQEIAGIVAAYGETDLLCYRADAPPGLAERQAAAWDPLLSWARDALGAALRPAVGVMFHPQPSEAVAALRQRVAALDAWELAALHELVALSGSLVIGLAAAARHHAPEDLWRWSRIDETWQAEHWGVDADAATVAAAKEQAFHDAAHLYRLLAV